MERAEEVVREVWSRWNAGRRDFDEELIDPECEVHSWLANRDYRGLDEVRDWLSEIDDHLRRLLIAPFGVAVALGADRAAGRLAAVDLREGRLLPLALRVIEEWGEARPLHALGRGNGAELG